MNDDAIPPDGELAVEPVNKITWALAGRVTDPGRHMFMFGWLTITAMILQYGRPKVVRTLLLV